MKRGCLAASVLVLGVLISLIGAPALAQSQQQQPEYTPAEYNAYTAAAKEANLQQRVKLLDDFVTKFPKSALLPYAYQTYYAAYNQLRDYPKTVEYADKLLAYGDKIDLATRLQALFTRAVAFSLSFNEKDPNAADQARRSRDAALEGLKVLGQIPKPQNLTDEQFAEQKKAPAALFNYTAGFAALQLKDYKAAEDSFKAALANNPKDPLSYFRLGVAYLQENPPQTMDGFWALARAVALKGPSEAQVRDYLRKRLLIYQQPGCDNLIDTQMNELIQLASSTEQRPVTFTIASADDLTKERQTGDVLADLKAGGDKAKLAWLAFCGSEFPEVVAKVIDVTPGQDAVVLRVYRGATPEETEAATAANMEVKVEGQPEAARLQKDDAVRFSGTLVGYDPEPFLLHWNKAKVNAEDIPPEKPEPGRRRPRRLPPKRPGA
jgi:tetratricopeptide (TPR) repeat protein